MNSEDEAYDPWPGCTIDRTGCHNQLHYYRKYSIDSKFAEFFVMDDKALYTLHDLDNIIINYAEAHKGIREHCSRLEYDAKLWAFFALEIGDLFKFYQIEKYVQPFIVLIPLETVKSLENKSGFKSIPYNPDVDQFE